MNDIRGLLMRWQFWALELQALLLAASTLIEGPRLIRSLRLPTKVIFAALAPACLAWTLAAGMAPRTSRILFDEQIYQGVAQNLSDLHLAQMCNDGTVEYGRLQCWRGEYNKEPNGYPYLLSVAYRVFGVSDRAAFRLNNAACAVSAALTVVLSMLLFDDLAAAAFAGLVFALIPIQLVWSNTAAVEPSAAMAAELAVLAAVWWARARTRGALVWLVAAVAFASTFRPESILVLPLAAFAIALLHPRSLAASRTWMAGLAAIVLSMPTTWLHLWSVRSESWGSGGSRFALSFLRLNLPVNLGFYFTGDRFPILFTFLAIAGLLAVRRWRESVLVAAYLVLFWGVFLVFYAGSYEYGADVRYSLMSYAPIAIFAGAGASAFAAFASRWTAGRTGRPIAAIAALIVVQFLLYAPLVRATGEEAWAARADVDYAKDFARTLPANAIVLTQTPSMFHIWGINAAQLSIAAGDPAYVQHLRARYSGGVFLHWGFWCNVSDETQVAFCRQTLERFDHELVVERRVRDYRYALYRLKLP
ncbi:MAG TPA: glycosyltransferase family 39 protein [Vicinamibacterales bacterium]|nr:glycosyltransferase family 39 protein [Vicinamibacterales bacterium]